MKINYDLNNYKIIKMTFKSNTKLSNRFTLTAFRQFLTIVLLAFLSLLTACNDSDDSTTGKEEEPKEEVACINAGEDGYQTLEKDGETREYFLHIPSSYDENTPTPLVVNFHGFGDCAVNFSESVGEFYGFNEVADNENFIVVYPQAVLREKGDVYWEPGDTGSENITENDSYFTKQLITDLNNNYNVDLSRVYATGYSNGGMMAYSLACSGSDFIAAVGIMSGIMLTETCEANEQTSVIHFHGAGDEVLPLDGNGDYQSVAEVVDFWLNHNGISASNLVSTELNNGDVLKEEYPGTDENVAVVLYTVNVEFEKAGGHVWFSGEIDGVTPNQILWDFLSGYSLDD